MSIKVELKGLDKAQKDLIKYNLAKRGQIVALVEETGLNIQTTAKKAVQVDTGRLRSSIRTLFKSTSGLSIEVGSEVKYAPYIEFGTSTNKAYPFLNPAAENEKPKYLKELKKILKEVK